MIALYIIAYLIIGYVATIAMCLKDDDDDVYTRGFVIFTIALWPVAVIIDFILEPIWNAANRVTSHVPTIANAIRNWWRSH